MYFSSVVANAIKKMQEISPKMSPKNLTQNVFHKYKSKFIWHCKGTQSLFLFDFYSQIYIFHPINIQFFNTIQHLPPNL